jgi:hypothetical protein
MTTARESLADLITHLNGIRSAVRTVEVHLQEAERTIFLLMEQQGLSGRYPGVTKPEERGS